MTYHSNKGMVHF